MVRVLLVCAAVSLPLLGCTSFKERQDRANAILNKATDVFVESVENAKQGKGQLVETLSSATEKLQATASELQERAAQLQNGVEKVAGAVQAGQEGIEEVRGALNVSGEEGEIAEEN